MRSWPISEQKPDQVHLNINGPDIFVDVGICEKKLGHLYLNELWPKHDEKNGKSTIFEAKMGQSSFKYKWPSFLSVDCYLPGDYLHGPHHDPKMDYVCIETAGKAGYSIHKFKSGHLYLNELGSISFWEMHIFQSEMRPRSFKYKWPKTKMVP